MNSRISSPPRLRPNGFTLFELMVVVGVIGLLASLLMPALARARTRANDVYCLNNLRQLGMAVMVYAGDNAEHLPIAERIPTLPTDPQNPDPRISDVLAGYVGKTPGTNSSTSASVFRCLMDKPQYFKKEGSSYEWNESLNDKPLKSVQTRWFLLPTERTPALYDYENFHAGGTNGIKNVVYLDGHVSALK